MKILGIDTSCDDTSAAVVEDGRRILSNVVSSQDGLHARFSGVVPEIASRRHVEMIRPVVEQALHEAGTGLTDLDAVAVCHGPGLIGSLLVGCGFAKALAYANAVPLVAVNHLEGHIFANFLEPDPPEFPFLAMVVSGGHTSLFHARGAGVYEEIARTVDDAAGEAYDKVAKLLGIGFPGGPVIDRLARQGDPAAVEFPRPRLSDSRDFSFSGLKTAVLYHHRKHPDTPAADVAAAFQAAILDVLVEGALREARRLGLRRLVLSGGVSANSALRERLKTEAAAEGIRVHLPSPELCTDNAAMIAAAAHHHFLSGVRAELDLNPKAYLPLDRNAVYRDSGTRRAKAGRKGHG